MDVIGELIDDVKKEEINIDGKICKLMFLVGIRHYLELSKKEDILKYIEENYIIYLDIVCDFVELIRNIKNIDTIDCLLKISNSNIVALIFNVFLEHEKENHETNELFEKFKIIFRKTRFDEFIDIDIFLDMSIEECREFDLKIYREFINTIDMFGYNINEQYSALGNVIRFFGLFKKDNKQKNRLNFVLDCLNPVTYLYQINNLKVENANVSECALNWLANNFEIDSELCYVNKNNSNRDLNGIIFDVYSCSSLQANINKLPKTLKSDILNIIENRCDKCNLSIYKIKNDLILDEVLNYYIEFKLRGLDYFINLFENINGEYDSVLCEFFMKNYFHMVNSNSSLDDIIYILGNFEEFTVQIDGKINILRCLSYLNNMSFNYEEGLEKFADSVKKAGVISDIKYKQYEKLYLSARCRTHNLVIRIPETIFEIDGITFSVETLRMDDPFLMYMSENNYFSNCQVIGNNAESVLNHLALSNDSRAFIVKIYENGECNYLAQSFLWQNESVLCFDNIETYSNTQYSEDILNIIVKIYQMWAQIIMDETNNFIKERVRYLMDNLYMDIENLDENRSLLTESKEVLKKQSIKTVVVGAEKDFLSHMGLPKLDVSEIRPKNYLGWTDTKEVYWLCGSHNIKDFDVNYVQKAIFTDEDEYIRQKTI